jgi:hypothetical protein
VKSGIRHPTLLAGYDTLLASDVSEAMTFRAAAKLDAVEAAAIKYADSPAPSSSFAAVRADVGELPFADASIAAVHCSAVGGRRGDTAVPPPKFTSLNTLLTA